MPKLTHPLLCWQLDADTVFGMLLGTDYQAIERNPRRLKSALAETLQREHERGTYVPEPEIEDARLKLVKVAVNLAHRTAKGSFPMPGATQVLVAAVFGPSEADGCFKCDLPWLDESFFY